MKNFLKTFILFLTAAFCIEFAGVVIWTIINTILYLLYSFVELSFESQFEKYIEIISISGRTLRLGYILSMLGTLIVGFIIWIEEKED
jgi:hypothetical protein